MILAGVNEFTARQVLENNLKAFKGLILSVLVNLKIIKNMGRSQIHICKFDAWYYEARSSLSNGFSASLVLTYSSVDVEPPILNFQGTIKWSARLWTIHLFCNGITRSMNTIYHCQAEAIAQNVEESIGFVGGI